MDAGNRSTARDPRRLAPQSVRRLRDVLGRNAPAFVRALQADLSFMLAAAGPTFGPLRLPGVALLEYDRAATRDAVRANLDELLTATDALAAVLRRLTRAEREPAGPDDETEWALFQAARALGRRPRLIAEEPQQAFAAIDRLGRVARHARAELGRRGSKRDAGKRGLLAAIARAYRAATGSLPDARTFGRLAAIVFADRERPDTTPDIRRAVLAALRTCD